MLLGETEGWLRDQVRGLRTYAGLLAGEDASYADEVEGCYGVRPRRVAEETFALAHERRDTLVPGRVTRRSVRKLANSTVVPPDRLLDLLAALVAELRERSRALAGLPEREEVDLEAVRDEPWLAFNYHQGGLRSRVVVNLDLPISAAELVQLAAHETYPGHHVEHAWKERWLVEERGLLEESIFLVPTPQSLVSEGIAEVGGGRAPGIRASAHQAGVGGRARRGGRGAACGAAIRTCGLCPRVRPV